MDSASLGRLTRGRGKVRLGEVRCHSVRCKYDGRRWSPCSKWRVFCIRSLVNSDPRFGRSGRNQARPAGNVYALRLFLTFQQRLRRRWRVRVPATTTVSGAPRLMMSDPRRTPGSPEIESFPECCSPTDWRRARGADNLTLSAKIYGVFGIHEDIQFSGVLRLLASDCDQY